MLRTGIQFFDVLQILLVVLVATQLYLLNRKRSEFKSGMFASVFLWILALGMFITTVFSFVPESVHEFYQRYSLDLICVLGSLWLFFISTKITSLPSALDLQKKNEALNYEIKLREKAQQDLQDLNLKLRETVSIRSSEIEAVIDSSPLAIMKLNERREVKVWNPAAEKLFGWSKDEVIGKPLPIIPGQKKEEHFDIFRSTLKGESLKPIETQRLRKDGTLVDVRVWNAPLKGPEFGQAAMAIFDDITDRLKARQELYEAKQVAEQKNNSKSLFLANTGHEIRTPLNAILGFSDILRTEKVDEDSLKKYADIISTNARALQNLIDDLLDLSKIEAGQLSIRPQQINLSDAFKEICATLHPKAEEKNIDLSCKGLEDLPKTVSIDPLRLRQIVINLVNNALKFTPSGHVHIIPKLKNNLLSIEIEDTGRGMNPEEIEKLFKPFAQANTEINFSYGGTGLGLFISKSLAKKMGGDVFIKNSGVGKGTTFVVEVAAHAVSELAKQHETTRVHNSSELKNRKILVVDDIPENRFLVSRFLGSSGSIVESADNGFEVAAKVEKFHPDIILLDIQMPGKDGYEVIHELRESGYKKPVIAMTAYSMREDVERCLSEGFDCHISKPVTKNDLINQVAACLS